MTKRKIYIKESQIDYIKTLLNEGKNIDFCKKNKYEISSSNGDLDYAHIVNEHLNKILSKINVNKLNEEHIITKRDALGRYHIDLSSFEPHKKLNEKIWPNQKINSKVRLKLLKIADDFIDTLNVDWVKPSDIILTGSLANYNWSKYSDFDLHIILDFDKVDKRTDFVKDYFDSKKNLWNETHENLKIYNFPVEVYVQNEKEQHASSGVYSLEKNKWITEPEKDNFKSIIGNKDTIINKSSKFMKDIDDLNKKYNKKDDKITQIIANKSKKLFDKIKSVRKEALKNGNEMSIGNIVFKVLRRSGYIEKLLELKNKTYDRLNTIK